MRHGPSIPSAANFLDCRFLARRTQAQSAAPCPKPHGLVLRSLRSRKASIGLQFSVLAAPNPPILIGLMFRPPAKVMMSEQCERTTSAKVSLFAHEKVP